MQRNTPEVFCHSKISLPHFGLVTAELFSVEFQKVSDWREHLVWKISAHTGIVWHVINSARKRWQLLSNPLNTNSNISYASKYNRKIEFRKICKHSKSLTAQNEWLLRKESCLTIAQVGDILRRQVFQSLHRKLKTLKIRNIKLLTFNLIWQGNLDACFQ